MFFVGSTVLFEPYAAAAAEAPLLSPSSILDFASRRHSTDCHLEFNTISVSYLLRLRTLTLMASSPCSPALSPQPHLLTLPAELRNRIYALLLVRTDFPAAHPEFYPNKPRGPSNVFPNILRTCKQINSEAVHFLYAKNHFSFGVSWSVLAWFCTIGSSNATLVSAMTIYIRLLRLRMGPFKDILRLAKGLRRLRVHSHMDNFAGDSSQDAMRVFFMMSPWLEAHPSLNLVMSKYKGGRRRMNDPEDDLARDAVFATFVACERDATEDDGKCFDIREGWEGLEEVYKESDVR